MALTFEWDDYKAQRNIEKHGVSFEEASSIFSDDYSVTIFDPDHSDDEDRFVSIGLSSVKRLLVVVHTDRGNNIRIISARVASNYERRQYEEESNSL